MDLDDLEHNTRDGLHIASLAGAWLGLVCGFGGLRDHGGQLSFAPRLPPGLTGLKFTVRWHGYKVRVTADAERAYYSLASEATRVRLAASPPCYPDLTRIAPASVSLTIRHHGEHHVLRGEEPLT